MFNCGSQPELHQVQDPCPARLGAGRSSRALPDRPGEDPGGRGGAISREAEARLVPDIRAGPTAGEEVRFLIGSQSPRGIEPGDSAPDSVPSQGPRMIAQAAFSRNAGRLKMIG